jgi:glucokinase
LKIGDIGGTNSRFSLIRFTRDSSQPEQLIYKKYPTQMAPSLNHNISLFVNECRDLNLPKPTYAVLAVAGPVSKNSCEKFSNAEKWPKIDGDEIAKEFNLENCRIINDFEAIGYSILKLSEEDVIQINECRGEEGNIKTVIGPGTGLGCCKLVPLPTEKGFKYYVFGGEGGHATFGAVGKEQCEYMNWFM